MKKIVWVRPSGTEIETNDRKETVEYAKAIGWKVKPKTRAKRTVKAKDDDRDS